MKSNKRILITGCCGFIGSHLVKKLVSCGFTVEGVDDWSSGQVENIFALSPSMQIRTVPTWFVSKWEEKYEETDKSDFVLFHDDFSSPAMIRRLANRKYDAVIHLAADPRVEYSVKHPVSTHLNNVQKTIELLNICSKVDTHVVFASSAAVYGNVAFDMGLGISEDLQKNPASPYALQKLQVEQSGRLFASLYGLKFTALRFFNIYGEGQDGGSAYSTVIASWVERIKSNQPLRLDGDGKQTRDYVNIRDVVDAIVLSLEAPPGEFNIASGVATTNNEILSILRKHVEFSIENSPGRIGDIKHSLANVKMASETLNFNAKINLVDGIKELLL